MPLRENFRNTGRVSLKRLSKQASSSLIQNARISGQLVKTYSKIYRELSLYFFPSQAPKTQISEDFGINRPNIHNGDKSRRLKKSAKR